MKRHLISQMRNEWRSNLWMIIELTIVSAVLWFLFSFLCMLVHVRTTHYGYDFSDVYIADVRFVGDDSPVYQPYDSAHSYRTDLQLLVAGLRSNPCVELVGMGQNAVPYNYDYYGTSYSYTEQDSTYTYYGNRRYVSPEVVKIIRLEGFDGVSTNQLAEILEKGNVIFSNIDPEYAEGRTAPEFFKGKEVYVSNDSSTVVRVDAIAYGLRRSDYEPLYAGVAYAPLGNRWPQDLIIRIKPGTDSQFMESLKPADKQIGNVYISNVQHIDRRREVAHLEMNTMIRNFVICATFLLIVIFLSFLGTFWFRTQQRVGEIAVRKVNGSTRSDIFRRFIGEGMMLLGVATVLATAIEFAALHFALSIIENLTGTYRTVAYEAMVVTVTAMALLIIAGIWLPARKAMNVNPAYALKDQ